jgi:hypothetical protein
MQASAKAWALAFERATASRCKARTPKHVSRNATPTTMALYKAEINGSRMAERFDAMDTNKDGKLS